MSIYQVKSKVNSQTINTDLEADSKDDAIHFYTALSVGEILEVKKYVYLNPSTLKKEDDKNYRYATVTMTFKNKPKIVVKIPKLKDNKSVIDIRNYFMNIYQNIEKIDIAIRDNF